MKLLIDPWVDRAGAEALITYAKRKKLNLQAVEVPHTKLAMEQPISSVYPERIRKA